MLSTPSSSRPLRSLRSGSIAWRWTRGFYERLQRPNRTSAKAVVLYLFPIGQAFMGRFIGRYIRRCSFGVFRPISGTRCEVRYHRNYPFVKEWRGSSQFQVRSNERHGWKGKRQELPPRVSTCFQQADWATLFYPQHLMKHDA